jgi:hypothetical protein
MLDIGPRSRAFEAAHRLLAIGKSGRAPSGLDQHDLAENAIQLA